MRTADLATTASKTGVVGSDTQFLRRRDAVPMTRDYMYEEEERLRGLEQPPAWHLAAE